nr:SDR family oxidoreductase [Lactobacillus selangorensis]
MGTALIIGASGDIGTATAKELAAAGWSLDLHYNHNQQRIQALSTDLHAQYPDQDFLPVQADLTDEASVAQLQTQLFSVDAVVFAAGITFYGLFQELSAEQLEQLWQIHVKSPLLLVQGLQEKLARSHHGRIVFVGSVYGGRGSAMEVAYSTVKGAQTAFANAYAQEVASLGITVNVIAPGAVATQMNAQFDGAAQAAIQATIPAGHFAAPQEIAYWVLALLDPRASYLTGQTLYVDGGWLK